MARIRLSISFEIPEGADREDCLAYAVEAVGCYVGSKRPPGAYGNDDPGDPMFELDRSSIRGSFATTRQNRRTIVRAEY